MSLSQPQSYFGRSGATTDGGSQAAIQAETKCDAVPQLSSSSDEHSVLVSRKVELEFQGDLASFTQNWTDRERRASRRFVLFQRRFDGGNKIHIRCTPVQSYEKSDQGITMSCIYHPTKKACYFTVWELLELLLFLFWLTQFAGGEKGKIRRNLDSLRPLTVHKHEEFHRIVSRFSEGRPYGINKAFRILAWSDLKAALCKLVSKYDVVECPGNGPIVRRRPDERRRRSNSGVLSTSAEESEQERRHDVVDTHQGQRDQSQQRQRQTTLRRLIAPDRDAGITQNHRPPQVDMRRPLVSGVNGRITHDSVVPAAEEVSQTYWSIPSTEQTWYINPERSPNQIGNNYFLPSRAEGNHDTQYLNLDEHVAQEIATGQRAWRCIESLTPHQEQKSTSWDSVRMPMLNHSLVNIQEVAERHPPAEVLQPPQYTDFRPSSLYTQGDGAELYYVNDNFEMSGHFLDSNATQGPGEPDDKTLNPYG